MNCLLNAFPFFLANPCIDFQRACVLWCVVFVIPVSVYVLPHYVRFMCLYEGCDFRSLELIMQLCLYL